MPRHLGPCLIQGSSIGLEAGNHMQAPGRRIELYFTVTASEMYLLKKIYSERVSMK